MPSDSNQHAEYAREKMIESYDREEKMSKQAAWEANGLRAESRRLERAEDAAIEEDRMARESELADLIDWPCQQLHGGRPPFIYQGVNENGHCKHPECHPRNDERTEVKDTDEIVHNVADFAKKTLLAINERYKKINGLEVK